jgi:acyl-CoA dehydrogenase
MDDLFTDALRQLLADQCTPQLVRDIEGGQSAAPLWKQLEESGFADALVRETQGGAGLSLTDVFPLFELCGFYAVPVPLAETMLARALLADAGVERPLGSITFAHAAKSADGRIRCALVPSGRVADWALVTHGSDCLLLPVAQAENLPAVFPLDASLQWPAAGGQAAQRVPGEHDLHTLQACIHAAQLAGALMNVFTRTLQYANERTQFGRPIGKFQAIQHQLSVISEHTFAARMAARIGCHARGHTPDRMRVAVAKARTSEAALEVASLSHSIHGAIGFTEEFDLQLFTRRLHAWRQAAGSESYWHTALGEELVDRQRGLALDLLRATTDIH